jgi:hypothetical protein
MFDKANAIQDQRFTQATEMQAQKELESRGFLTDAAQQAEQARLTGQDQAMGFLGDANRQAMGFQQQGYDDSLGFTQPYRQAGGQALQGMQNLTTDAGRGQALQDYYAGDEYGALAGQREEQALRMGAATGGVRGGNTQASLANIAPQLGQQHLANKYGQLAGLSSMGANMSSQAGQNALGFGGAQAGLAQGFGGAQAGLAQNTQNALAGDRFNLGAQQASNAMNTGINYGNAALNVGSQSAQNAMNLGGNISNLQQQSGQAQAQNSLTPGGIFSNLLSGLGGMAGGSGAFAGSGGGGGGGGINYGGGYKNDNYLI